MRSITRTAMWLIRCGAILLFMNAYFWGHVQIQSAHHRGLHARGEGGVERRMHYSESLIGQITGLAAELVQWPLAAPAEMLRRQLTIMHGPRRGFANWQALSLVLFLCHFLIWALVSWVPIEWWLRRTHRSIREMIAEPPPIPGNRPLAA